MKQQRQEEEEMEEEPSFALTDKVSVHVIRLAFSVPEANDRGIVYLHTLVSTLRDNPYLPMLGAKFAKEKADMLDRLPDGTVFMDRDFRIFKRVVSRLRIPDLDMATVPPGVSEEEWRGELSYWGYRAYEGSRKDEAPFLTKIVSKMNGEAKVVLGVIQCYLEEDGLYERIDHTDSVGLWFLYGLSFSTPSEKYPTMDVGGWLRLWGTKFDMYFTNKLGLPVRISNHDRKGGSKSCRWPSSIFQATYDPFKHGHAMVSVRIKIRGV